MNSWKRVLGLILLLFGTMGSMGCALFLAAGVGAGAAIGASEYIRGEMKQAYGSPMENVWNASLAAAEELKMKSTQKSIDNLDQNRWIKGKTYEGKDFEIALEALSKDVTMVKLRIGVFGDESYSKRIQEVIGQNLKK